MVTPQQRSKIRKAERELLHAQKRLNASITDLALRINIDHEDKAFEAYVLACAEAGICEEVGCWNLVIVGSSACADHDQSPLSEEERLQQVISEASEALAEIEAERERDEGKRERG